MARRSSRRRAGPDGGRARGAGGDRTDRLPRPLSAGGFGTLVRIGDDAYQVRTVTGAAAVKQYRCPGCQQSIPVGTAHLVVWPDAEAGGVAERRHWHTGCWRRVEHRRF